MLRISNNPARYNVDLCTNNNRTKMFTSLLDKPITVAPATAAEVVGMNSCIIRYNQLFSILAIVS